MNLLLFERLIIQSDLSPDEALQRLNSVVETKGYSGSGREGKPYEGIVNEHHFIVSRIGSLIGGRRDLVTVMVDGVIEPEGDRCSIRMAVYPHVVVIVLLLLWVGGSGILFLVNLLPAEGCLILNAILVVPCILLYVRFNLEAGDNKSFFRRLFQTGRTN